MTTHKALVLHQFGQIPVYEDFPKPVPQPGQLLVKVEASTINVSDRYRIENKLQGIYNDILPSAMGGEGVGRVVEANGEDIKHWVGRRVSFIQVSKGTWAEFALTTPDVSFPIDEDVPLTSAASGVVNPLTVLGMIHIYENTKGKKGIIHTAAASALGRMLNKRCQTLGIPLLNIVRREEQAQLLRNEGAKHIIITKGDWQAQYNAAIKEHGFNVLFDALGGGPILDHIITGLSPNSWVHIYGLLQGVPLQVKSGIDLSKGVFITGYIVVYWYAGLSQQEKEVIKKTYSSLLKEDLATTSFKTLKYSQIGEALKLSVSKALEGKITLVPN